jgi:hypothetical protein
MVFVQTAAPTGFTKSVTHDNKALRVVSGTAGSGGSVAFTTAFASQTPSGTVSVSGSAGNTTLTTPQIPSHNHSAAAVGGTDMQNAGGPTGFRNAAGGSTGNTGGGGAHSHPLTISSATFSGNAINLAVQYVDVIIATKD